MVNVECCWLSFNCYRRCRDLVSKGIDTFVGNAGVISMLAGGGLPELQAANGVCLALEIRFSQITKLFGINLWLEDTRPRTDPSIFFLLPSD